MQWITTKTVTVTKTVTEVHGPLKILLDYVAPGLAIFALLLVFWGTAAGVLPRP